MKKISIILTSLFLPFTAMAIDLGGSDLEKVANTAQYSKNTTVEGIIGSVINIFLGLLGVIFLVLIVYGGYQWLIARGDESKVELAKNTITRSVIGLAIVLGAYAITYFVLGQLIQKTLVQ